MRSLFSLKACLDGHVNEFYLFIYMVILFYVSRAKRNII